MPGVFITFEGPEGGGKSTQSKLLADALERAGYSILRTREPGGTPLGDGVRGLLLDPKLEVSAMAEFLLFSASRAQIVRDVIRPALERNQIVICDRYADSSLAYQGWGRGLNREFLHEVTWEATGGLRPHVTVLLDLEPKLGLERADLEFHRAVRTGFLALADAEPERFLTIDATRPALEIHEWILAAVTGSLEGM